MQIQIGNFRIRRYDSLNLCVEEKKVKQKAKNPYGRNGKPVDGEIAQNNSSNKIEYKYHLVGYYSTLELCFNKLVEHCLTNNEEINTIKNLQDQITQLHEKISKISAKDERFIEQNLLSSSADQTEEVERIAQEALDRA